MSVPKEKEAEALENLAKLVENKGGLMARAFQADDIRLTVTEDAVSFPWFPFTANPNETTAYTEFVDRHPSNQNDTTENALHPQIQGGRASS